MRCIELTYIPRVPPCLFLRRNWDPPPPSPASECVPPPLNQRGGTHSPAGKGVGESQSGRLEKKHSTRWLVVDLSELQFIWLDRFSKIMACVAFALDIVALWLRCYDMIGDSLSLALIRVRSHAPSIRSHRGTKVIWPDFQPMRVPEEPVCIDLFR